MSESEDVVVLPAGVVAKGEVRIIAPHLLDLVAADEADVRDARAGERAQRPIEHTPAVTSAKHLGVSAVVGINRRPRPAPMMMALISRASGGRSVEPPDVPLRPPRIAR